MRWRAVAPRRSSSASLAKFAAMPGSAGRPNRISRRKWLRRANLGPMLKWLEQFSEANQHTIAALGAISTFAAVVGSLRAETRDRLG
jgi:hypothetical protein